MNPIPENEYRIRAVRSQGAGGQNVNKVATAAHLRFDISASSLPTDVKERLFALKDRRISETGVLVIKAQRFRTQEKNREDAVNRLQALIEKAMEKRVNRKATRPSRAAKEKRLEAKQRRARVKSLRGGFEE